MNPDRLSAAFQALADPTRRAILARLAAGEATVGELAAPFPISLPAISRHLGVLSEAGLIEQRREAQRRICRLKPHGLKAAGDWIEAYRSFWEDRFIALARLVEDEPERKNARRQNRRQSKTQDRRRPRR